MCISLYSAVVFVDYVNIATSINALKLMNIYGVFNVLVEQSNSSLHRQTFRMLFSTLRPKSNLASKKIKCMLHLQ